MPEPEPVTGEIIEAVAPTALESLTRGEIDVQIATAHRYPRSIERFKRQVKNLACLDQATAESCFYSLPREGKTITGPSVRLAEIVSASYQNLRVAGRVISEDGQFITAQGVCHDLENNVAQSAEVRRRITDRSGHKYSADMIAVTANAAVSIAMRNAIFKVVPMATVADVMGDIKRVAGGDERSLELNRTAALEYLKREYKVDAARACAALQKAGIADITTEDLATLRGFVTAIKDGDATVETCFPIPAQTNGNGKTGVQGLADKLKGQQQTKPEAPPQTTPFPPATGDVDPAQGVGAAAPPVAAPSLQEQIVRLLCDRSGLGPDDAINFLQQKCLTLYGAKMHEMAPEQLADLRSKVERGDIKPAAKKQAPSKAAPAGPGGARPA